ncbi:MAG TPA: hypothetical protein PK668_03120 [Myxococcota bacterium]|nr:hypothetical protein [Myxococcota bacterium]HRY91845.1 hypothetical protein [Myxococcota bacterium]HSA20568.1 hypothetical protein [Myxococcota bacterium]
MTRTHGAWMIVAALAAGCGSVDNDFLYHGEGTLTGRLLQGGAPAPGALVFVRGEPRAVTTTDLDGRFELAAVSGRDRQLVALWGASHGLRRGVDLPGDRVRDLGELLLSGVGVIEGRLEFAAPRRAAVRVEGTPLVLRPDDAGRFRVGLPAGDWELVATAVGALEARAGVRPRPGQAVSVGAVPLQADPAYVCQPGEPRTEVYSQGGGGALDLLLVVDSSGSMAADQLVLAQNLRALAASLEATLTDFRLAIITPGIECPGCPPCDGLIMQSCTNETGESGRFQDRRGRIDDPTTEPPTFAFTRDPACRVITRDNLDCLWREADQSSVALVGTNGCGYERPLAAMRLALSAPLADVANQGFLREHARLAVLSFTDEEDCGEVGEVTEGMSVIGGKVCYYASRGEGPDGSGEDPVAGLPYRLTPVEDYAAFLRELKGGDPARATFSVIAGVDDPGHPEDTTIEYVDTSEHANVQTVCARPGCTGPACQAYPSTRQIALALATGGAIESICQEDYTDATLRVGGLSSGARLHFPLGAAPVAPETVRVEVAGQPAQGWSLELDQPAIGFAAEHTPPAFSQVRVDYEATCP